MIKDEKTALYYMKKAKMYAIKHNFNLFLLAIHKKIRTLQRISKRLS